MYKNILILGRGIGQVMFQNNALSGGLMLLGIAFLIHGNSQFYLYSVQSLAL